MGTPSESFQRFSEKSHVTNRSQEEVPDLRLVRLRAEPIVHSAGECSRPAADLLDSCIISGARIEQRLRMIERLSEIEHPQSEIGHPGL